MNSEVTMKPTVSRMKDATTIITMPKNSLLLRNAGMLPTNAPSVNSGLPLFFLMIWMMFTIRQISSRMMIAFGQTSGWSA